LLLKDAFQPRQDDKALPLIIIIHHSKLNFAISFLQDGRLQLKSASKRSVWSASSVRLTRSGNGTILIVRFSGVGDAVGEVLTLLLLVELLSRSSTAFLFAVYN
jgi:hypothetical protein